MKKNKYYGDSTHGKRNTTSCFGKYVSADEIPYIVVPPSESRYKYSLGVIIDTNNGNYLYCVVAEIGPEANGSFTYDAEGLRTGKMVNGEKTIYVWDGDQVVMELSKGGSVQKCYIRGNDLVYADKGENTEKTYYVTDMHGNVVQLLDESGNVTKTYE